MCSRIDSVKRRGGEKAQGAQERRPLAEKIQLKTILLFKFSHNNVMWSDSVIGKIFQAFLNGFF